MERNQERYLNTGYGLFAVCLKETEELLGDCGLVEQILNNRVEVEIGCCLGRERLG
ncbi:GNAT family N-acetyltransferase [Peribacillus deserti]|uniref:GNAT family N-acetyltransferase n=1 Tax=Peribacillus deserti TaxID=673318 RepID=UPI0035B5165B